MDNQIYNIISDMSEVLDIAQMKKLQEVLIARLTVTNTKSEENNNSSYLEMFLTAKRIEGCSERTIEYYRSTIRTMLNKVDIPVRNYILKSPIRRIHKVKTKKVVKEMISDENLEQLRDGCCEKRDLAIIDILISIGIRVGELVNLDIVDLDFEERECIVYGKGDKERKVYFDARTKLHIQNYLAERVDCNPALFVSLNVPYQRLQISGIETRLRELGRKLQIYNIHPHKFRRTMATKAIDKGMPIEQVQKLLAHQ